MLSLARFSLVRAKRNGSCAERVFMYKMLTVSVEMKKTVQEKLHFKNLLSTNLYDK